jgi:RND family efflux transporter MFP subunit
MHTRDVRLLAQGLMARLRDRLHALRIPTRLLVLSIVLVALLAGGVGFYYKSVYAPAQASTEQAVQTATARLGSLTISATGSGTLTAPQKNLGFTAGGELTVTGVYVKVGDLVKAGDLLAEVNSQQAQLAYATAESQYQDLTSPTAVAAALRAMADGRASLQSAQLNLEYLISPDVYYWETEIEKGEKTLKKRQSAVDEAPSDETAQRRLGEAQAFLDFAQDKLKDARKKYEDEYVPETFRLTEDADTGVDTYLVPTELEIKLARVEIGKARTELNESTELYEVLTGAPIPEDTTNASLIELERARRSLQDAQATLDGSKIIAPFDGTVLQVNAAGGDTAEVNTTSSGTVDASKIIVLANTSQPYLEVYWDESDWAKLKVGNTAEITFDDLPDQVFTGTITQVDRELYSNAGSTAIAGEVSLDTSISELNLPVGASASVAAISQKVENAVLIPIEALHEYSTGKYAVFVLKDGKLSLRRVEVGLQDAQYAQITSGLEAGEVVTTGLTQTK